jgi:glycosyltransferase involved in cell wall biosynthesis/SAM-dependent methyltransferase
MVSDVSPSPAEGGGPRVLWEQSSRLVARGHDVCVVCRAPTDGDASTAARQGVRIRCFAVDRRTVYRFIASSVLGARRAVALELGDHGADVLHVHQPLAGYGVLTSAAVRGLPCLYSFHSPAPLEYRSRRGMTVHHRGGLTGRLGLSALWGVERACLRRATAIHVLSDYSRGLLWKLYRVPRDRVVKIPGGADTARFRPPEDRAAVRKALDLPAERPVLLTVRNLEGRMGLDLLIRAMAILARHMPEALLLIGGGGTLRGELESLRDALGLRERVRFLGFVPDEALPHYYQAADVFVLPSRELEGFGLVTVEALACGTPVLGTPVGATPEILLPLSPALVFRDLAPETMAEELRRFLEAERRDPEAHARLREACRRHVEARYTWDCTLDALEAELARLATRPAGSAAWPVVCPACGSQTRPSSLLYRGSPYRACPRCRSSVVATPPTALELQRYYQTQYPRRFSPARVNAERAELFVSLLDRLDALGAGSTSDGILLDVGCGGGHLLRAARQRGWRTVGTDLSWEACAVTDDRARRGAVQADAGRLPFRDGSVDVVMLVNVADQAGEPNAILREAHRVLAPGRLLVIRVPNASFHRPWVRMLGALGLWARWREWDAYPIVHHVAFTAPGLRFLVERAEFTVLELKNSALAAGGTRAWRRALVGAAAAVVARASRNRWLVGPSIELYARKEPGRTPAGFTAGPAQAAAP